jgi:hypothetical protein
MTDTSYIEYIRTVSSISPQEGFLFSSYGYKKHLIEGTCDAWEGFIGSGIDLPTDEYVFNELRIGYMRYELDEATPSVNTSFTCGNTSKVKSFMQRVGSALTGLVQMECDGSFFRAKLCAGIGRVLCADCYDPCLEMRCSDVPQQAVMSPCLACEDKSNHFSYMSLNYERIIRSPGIFLPLNVMVGRFNATIQVSLSKVGIVYCGALTSGDNLWSGIVLKQTGYSATVLDVSESVSITIFGLQPDTPYDIYCYTEGFDGHTMPHNETLATKTSILTDCCSSVIFSEFHEVLVFEADGDVSSMTDFIYTVGLDTTPATATGIELHYEVLSPCDLDVPDFEATLSFSQETINIGAESRVLSGSFVVSGTPGCYQVSGVAKGARFYETATRSLFIQSFPLAPQLSTASLSNDGLTLTVHFDSRTDRGITVVPDYATLFSCDSVLKFTGSANASCLWASDSELIVYSASGVMVGDNITLRDTVIKPLCSSTPCPYSNASAVPVQAPINPEPPIISMRSARIIGTCEDITIDTTLTRGSGGRPWSTITWNVSTTANQTEQSVNAIEVYLNSVYTGTDRLVNIPQSFLAVGVYTISLQLTSVFGRVSKAEIDVEISSFTLNPKVIIPGPLIQTVYRWRPTSIFASASLPTCEETANALQYEWRLYLGPIYQSNLTSTSLDPRYFMLPAFVLEIATSYTLKVIVTSRTSSTMSFSADANVELQVQPAGVLASIQGGTARTVSTEAVVTVNASGSYDLDYPASSLVYEWGCKMTHPRHGDDCPFDTPSLVAFIIRIGQVSESGAMYLLSLKAISSIGMVGEFNQTLTFIDSVIPELSVVTSKDRYALNEKIIISASLEGDVSLGTITASWSAVNDDQVDLAAVAITPLSKSFAADRTVRYDLAIPANLLQSGVTYAFALSVAYASAPGAAMESTVSVVMNGAPSGGYLHVSPSNGLAMQTDFVFETGGWVDADKDYPLTFIIAYYPTDVRSQTIIKNQDVLTYKSAKVGQGSENDGYTQTCIVYANDALDSWSSITKVIVVGPTSFSDNLASDTEFLLAEAFRINDIQSVNSVVGAISSVLNKVNCTVPTPCESLNRAACSTTAHTCGACLAGTGSIEGHSNKPCVSIDPVRRLQDGTQQSRYLNTESFGVNGAPCTEDTFCLSGRCGASGICRDSTKLCPNNCTSTSNGFCAYYGPKKRRQDTCLQLDTHCSAKCECASGWNGEDCSKTDEEFAAQSQVRSELCHAMLRSTETQGITSDIAVARATSLAAIMEDPTQLSDEALTNCTEVLVRTIFGDPVVAGGTSTLLLHSMHVFSLALDRANSAGPSSLPEGILASIYDGVSVLAEGVQAGKALDEFSDELITRNIRIFISVMDALAVSTSIAIPQTTYEIIHGVQVTPINVSIANDFANSFGLSAVQFINDPRNASADAAPVGLQVTEYTLDGVGTRRISEEASASAMITFVNHEVLDNYFTEDIDGNRTVDCEFSFSPYNISIDCPFNETLEYECAGVGGTYHFICPPRLYRQDPQCYSWDGTAFSVDPQCTVVTFDSTTTTCSCVDVKGSMSASRQRALTSLSEGTGLSGFAEFTSTATQTSSAFVNFFDSDQSYPDASLEVNVAAGVLISILLALSFAGVFGLGVTKQKNALKKNKNVKAKPARVSWETFADSCLPLEYSRRRSGDILWEALRKQHEWMRLFTKSSRGDNDLCAVRWFVAIAVLMNILFVGTIVAYIFYRDDGSCEGKVTRDACLSVPSYSPIDNVCNWDGLFNQCTYNENAGLNFLGTYTLVTIITCLAVPLNHVCQILVNFARRYFTLDAEAEAREPLYLLEENETVHDLHEHQKLTTTILRAARLEKMSSCIDGVSVGQEARDVLGWCQEPSNNMRTVVRHAHIAAYLRRKYPLEFYLKGFFIKAWSDLYVELAEKAITRARKETVNIVRETSSIPVGDVQEQFLIRNFILHSLRGPQKVIGRHFMHSSTVKPGPYSATERQVQLLCLIALNVYAAAITTCVIYFSLVIGRAALLLWITSAVYAALLWVIVLRPLEIYVRSVSLASTSRDAIARIHSTLRNSARLWIRHPTHLVTNTDAFVQHFNPACRAARSFPRLAVSRVLMALQDSDIPGAAPLQREHRDPWYRQVVHTVGGTFACLCASTMTCMPPALFDVGIDFFVVSAFNLIIIGIGVLGHDISYIPVLIIIAGIILICVGSVLRERCRVRTAVVADPIPAEVSQLESVRQSDASIPEDELDKHPYLGDDEAISTGPRDRLGYRRAWFNGISKRGYSVLKKSEFYAEIEVQSGTPSSRHKLSGDAEKWTTYTPPRGAVRAPYRSVRNSEASQSVRSSKFSSKEAPAIRMQDSVPSLVLTDPTDGESTKWQRQSRAEYKEESKSVSSESYGYHLSLHPMPVTPTKSPEDKPAKVPVMERPPSKGLAQGVLTYVDDDDDDDDDDFADDNGPPPLWEVDALADARMPTGRSAVSQLSTKSSSKHTPVNTAVRGIPDAFVPIAADNRSESTARSDSKTQITESSYQPYESSLTGTASMLREPAVEQIREMSAQSMGDVEHSLAISQWLADKEERVDDEDVEGPDYHHASLASQVKALQTMTKIAEAQRRRSQQPRQASPRSLQPANKMNAEKASLKEEMEDIVAVTSSNSMGAKARQIIHEIDEFNFMPHFDDEIPLPDLLDGTVDRDLKQPSMGSGRGRVENVPQKLQDSPPKQMISPSKSYDLKKQVTPINGKQFRAAPIQVLDQGRELLVDMSAQGGGYRSSPLSHSLHQSHQDSTDAWQTMAVTYPGPNPGVSATSASLQKYSKDKWVDDDEVDYHPEA